MFERVYVYIYLCTCILYILQAISICRMGVANIFDGIIHNGRCCVFGVLMLYVECRYCRIYPSHLLFPQFSRQRVHWTLYVESFLSGWLFNCLSLVSHFEFWNIWVYTKLENLRLRWKTWIRDRAFRKSWTSL